MMIVHETIEPAWQGLGCIVAATGPSLTPSVANVCQHAHFRGSHKVIAVNDAYRLLPWADVLYSCDGPWWDYHKGVPNFRGERWSSTAPIDRRTRQPHNTDDKTYWAQKWKLNLVRGELEDGFSLDPARIHYGGNSGFQAINLALLRGARPVILVGFNMQSVDAKAHFFGSHPRELRRHEAHERFIPHFKRAANLLPPGVTIINATPNSALTTYKVFAYRELEAALMLEGAA